MLCCAPAIISTAAGNPAQRMCLVRPTLLLESVAHAGVALARELHNEALS